MDLSTAVEQYLNALRGTVSQKTTLRYTGALNSFQDWIGKREVESITIADLRAFRASLFDRKEKYADRSRSKRPRQEGTLSPHTIHKCLQAVRQLFRWLQEEELISTNPAQRLKLPGLGNEPPKGITEDDLRKLLDAARDSARDYAILLFLADTGARLGGITGLKIQDLDLANRRALVREKGRKGQPKARRVYFKPKTAAALQEWLDCRAVLQQYSKFKTDFVFTSPRGHLTGWGIYQMIDRLAQRAGIESRHNPHSFRHGLACALLERGADLARVSQILGHSSVVVTAQFYARFTDQKLQNAHDQFSWIDEVSAS